MICLSQAAIAPHLTLRERVRKDSTQKERQDTYLVCQQV